MTGKRQAKHARGVAGHSAVVMHFGTRDFGNSGLPREASSNMATASIVSVASFALVVLPCLYQTPKTFVWHPILMGAAVLIAMTQALLPLYARPRSERYQARERHMKMQMLSSLLMFGGLIAILLHKRSSNLAYTPHTLHGWSGVLVVAAVAVQAGIGMAKGFTLVSTGRRIFRWHGTLGSWLWIGCCMVATLGVMCVLPPTIVLLASVSITALCFKVFSCFFRIYFPFFSIS